jgi:hypothetical protein
MGDLFLDFRFQYLVYVETPPATLLTQLHEMFKNVLDKTRGDDQDMGRVGIPHPQLNNPIVVHLPMAVAKHIWLSFDIFIKDLLMAMKF